MLKRVLLFFTLIFVCLLSASSVLYFYVESESEKLVKGYPVWKDDKYILVTKKPKDWVSLARISESVKWAIILSEDWAFYDHPGVDFNQLEIVIRESYEEGKLTRGASTITQQLVKNSLLTQEKTLIRKFKEILLTLMIETKMTKDQILEKYLNMIELGKDLYGVGNAANFYFKKSVSKLNPKEAAFLAMLLPSPIRYSQSYQSKELTDFAKEQVSSILLKMKQAHKITDEKRIEMLDKPLSFEKRAEIKGPKKADLGVFEDLEFYD